MRAHLQMPALEVRIELLSSFEFRPAKCSVVSSSRSKMSDEGAQYFEGVEKLLEIWFTTNDPADETSDLRKIPSAKLKQLLEKVHCEIISFMKNDQIDAYVLSESSMFVSKHRFILKTCGTTTPLLCLEKLLSMVKQYSGFTEVEHLFYSRKNYKRPELQVSPHQHFNQEVALLKALFPSGLDHNLGAIDKDCWYLYTLNPPLKETLPEIKDEPDQTLEILMTDLDPKIMSIFSKEECATAPEATRRSGIDKIVPNMIIDDYLFEPCGYSMNGITKSGCYMTIHITPEPGYSYVSFETNVPSTSYKEIITKVVNTFLPEKFLMTVFVNKAVSLRCITDQLENLNFADKWKRREKQHREFNCYDLIYTFYRKFPS